MFVSRSIASIGTIYGMNSCWPREYYDPESITRCRAAGMSVVVQEVGALNVELKMRLEVVPRAVGS